MHQRTHMQQRIHAPKNLYATKNKNKKYSTKNKKNNNMLQRIKDQHFTCNMCMYIGDMQVHGHWNTEFQLLSMCENSRD